MRDESMLYRVCRRKEEVVARGRSVLSMGRVRVHSYCVLYRKKGMWKLSDDASWRGLVRESKGHGGGCRNDGRDGGVVSAGDDDERVLNSTRQSLPIRVVRVVLVACAVAFDSHHIDVGVVGVLQESFTVVVDIQRCQSKS